MRALKAYFRRFLYPFRTRSPLRRVTARYSKRYGLTSAPRKPAVIVTLTTMQNRLTTTHLCIESLLRQTFPPDRIVLWISEREAEDSRMENLRRMEKRGLEISLVPDIRSYGKLIYALERYPEAILVTADDDMYYPPNWLERLYHSCRDDPTCIHCHRAHLMTKDSRGCAKPYGKWAHNAPGIVGPSYELFATGNGGVLYPPGSLHPDVLDRDNFLSLCPTADDIWFKAMALRKNTRHKKVAPHTDKRILKIRNTQHVGLFHENVFKDRNTEQFKNVFDHYDLYALIGMRAQAEHIETSAEALVTK